MLFMLTGTFFLGYMAQRAQNEKNVNVLMSVNKMTILSDKTFGNQKPLPTRPRISYLQASSPDYQLIETSFTRLLVFQSACFKAGRN